MTTNVITVSTTDPVKVAHDTINSKQVHHLPVVDDEKLVGMLSSSDLLFFLRAIHPDSQEQYLNELRLKNYKVKEIMSEAPLSLEPSDSIETALKIFAENMFHAVPIVENMKVVGILTTHDIIVETLKG
ncbi:MAG: CBS domain-containing protein [Saprospiraceae bacterium]